MISQNKGNDIKFELQIFQELQVSDVIEAECGCKKMEKTRRTNLELFKPK